MAFVSKNWSKNAVIQVNSLESLNEAPITGAKLNNYDEMRIKNLKLSNPTLF